MGSLYYSLIMAVDELILKKDLGETGPEEDEDLEIKSLTTDEEEDEVKTQGGEEEQNGYEGELGEEHEMEPMSVEGENHGHADAVMEG